MQRSFADTLIALGEYFPSNLVVPAEFEKLQGIGKSFPSLVSMGAAFESRLGEIDPFLDFFFAITPATRSILAGTHPNLQLNPALFSDPVWQQVQTFFAAWGVPDSLLDQYVEQVFLEYDVGAVIPSVPVPAVFMQINDRMYQRESGQNHGSIGGVALDWLFDGLAILKRGPVSPETLANARKCFEKLLPGTRIDHAAIMASREPDVMRLNVTNLSADQLYDYLEAIGLGTRIEQLQTTFTDLDVQPDYLVLAMDVSEAFSPRIGIELRFDREVSSRVKQPRWRILLDQLVEKGLCLPQKRDGLFEWIGSSREIFDPELYQFMIYRYIDLVKLVFVPDQPPAAKAYFSFIIHPFD